LSAVPVVLCNAGPPVEPAIARHIRYYSSSLSRTDVDLSPNRVVNERNLCQTRHLDQYKVVRTGAGFVARIEVMLIASQLHSLFVKNEDPTPITLLSRLLKTGVQKYDFTS